MAWKREAGAFDLAAADCYTGKKSGLARNMEIGMEIRKNDRFTLELEDMSEDGAGIGMRDGYICDENEEKLWICQAYSGFEGGAGACSGALCCGEAVRRLSASGAFL